MRRYIPEMKIAVTRLAGKEKSDAARCEKSGHSCYSVHPLRSELREVTINDFLRAAGSGEFDCLFFTSALPAKIIAPRLKTWPRVIAIGPQTARELELFGIPTETLPSFYSRDFVPYLGDWIRGKRIGIPRADVPNEKLISAITDAGGIPREFRCYGLQPTGESLSLEGAEAILFTSAMSYTTAIWTPRPDLLVMAIGEITAAAMHSGGHAPSVVGDGSLEGTLTALNEYLPKKETPELTAVVASKEPVHLWSRPGIIVVDKPKGPSSHQVAAWVGKMVGCQVGHSGTLDPQVSGVLLVMLGNAVRLAPLLLQHDKEYVCLMRLHKEVPRENILKVAEEFTGRLYQRPPRKSAVKRALRIREVQKLEILDIDGRLVLLKVQCDAGTYIRSLCHHMGMALGVGGHMQELRRTRSGVFDEKTMYTLHDVEDACVAAKAGDSAYLASMILSVDQAVPELPAVVIRDSAIDAVCHGAILAGVGVISCAEFAKGQTVAVLSQKNEFVCLGKTLVPSSAFKPGETGLIIAPTTVFMAPGTYAKGWTKSDKVIIPKPKAPAGEKKAPVQGQSRGPGRRPGPRPAWNRGPKPEGGFAKKRYH
jgi:predicted rRNA pseudouridine synthase